MEEITAPGEEQGITEKNPGGGTCHIRDQPVVGLFYDGIRGDLDAAVSGGVSTVTDGRYDHVSVDSDGKLCPCGRNGSAARGIKPWYIGATLPWITTCCGRTGNQRGRDAIIFDEAFVCMMTNG